MPLAGPCVTAKLSVSPFQSEAAIWPEMVALCASVSACVVAAGLMSGALLMKSATETAVPLSTTLTASIVVTDSDCELIVKTAPVPAACMAASEPYTACWATSQSPSPFTSARSASVTSAEATSNRSVSRPALPASTPPDWPTWNTSVSLPPPPEIVSLPATPSSTLAATLPKIWLASALPVPEMSPLAVSTRFSTLSASVALIEACTVSVPPPTASTMVIGLLLMT